jgi:GT2 family glycosyltransferase
MTSVTVVTPWHEHLELARDYWNAMRLAGFPPVLVIDNGSKPPLPNAHRLDWNSGFAHASNVGLELATTEAVLFLNNDIAATSGDWLERLRAEIEPGVLVGANLRYDAHGEVDGEPFPYLDGWCLGGMREDLLELGGFDESYEAPGYYTDNDLCLRARAAGLTLREVRVGLIHKVGSTVAQNGHVIPSTIANRERFQALARELMAVAA